MKNQWLGKNVDLSMLAERVKPFFSRTDFETTVEGIQEGYIIQAVSKIPNLKFGISATIFGRPSDFTVEFCAGSGGGYFSPTTIAGYLTAMFGGGYLVSREAQKREALDKLENDFWRHVQVQVADLAGSATEKKSRGRPSLS